MQPDARADVKPISVPRKTKPWPHFVIVEPTRPLCPNDEFKIYVSGLSDEFWRNMLTFEDCLQLIVEGAKELSQKLAVRDADVQPDVWADVKPIFVPRKTTPWPLFVIVDSTKPLIPFGKGFEGYLSDPSDRFRLNPKTIADLDQFEDELRRFLSQKSAVPDAD